MHKLTKQAINRLKESPITVGLWNGCFNRATVKAKFARYTIEIYVDVTHPELVWQCGDKKDCYLIDWRDGYQQPIPEELNELVERMKQAATMTDAYAKALSDKNRVGFLQCMHELRMT